MSVTQITPTSDPATGDGGAPSQSAPSLSAVVELLKPITWFAPMWAFACGVVSSGVSVAENWVALLLGVLLAGPVVCGMSQAANDWCDRHVDAINEPNRPIPSGRVPGRWGLWIALALSAAAFPLAWTLGPWVFGATALGVALAWAYSAEPVRLKKSGWWGPAAVALSYEGLTWFTGAAAMLGALPRWEIVALALLYSVGAHGIMTLNDFKAIDGDRRTGVRSLPATLGVDRAARLACAVMAVPQLVVVSLLIAWGLPLAAVVVAGLLAAQFALMPRLLAAPKAQAPWYNATGTSLYVLGMMASAVALGGTA
ncbi:MAG: chlorophyll synthase ChlG [Pseudomonadota bacterium]